MRVVPIENRYLQKNNYQLFIPTLIKMSYKLKITGAIYSTVSI